MNKIIACVWRPVCALALTAVFTAWTGTELQAAQLTNIPGELVFNEIQASNGSFQDPFGEYDDWVEIYNPNTWPLDLAGMYFTDSHYSISNSYWTQIPTGSPEVTTVPAYGFLIVWYDDNPGEGPLHVNNKLGASSDAVYLIGSDGATVIDMYTWNDTTGLNESDVSLGRNPDGSTVWQLYGVGQSMPCTPGSSNQGSVNPAPVISNISHNPNPISAGVPLSITARVTDDNLAAVQLLWGLDDFTLNTTAMNLQGGVYAANIGSFTNAAVIQYRIRAVDEFNLATLSPIFNITIGYQPPELVINEIMANNLSTVTDDHGDYEDWVELYNPGPEPVNLAGYFLLDSHYGDFSVEMLPVPGYQPDSTTIAAGGYKVFWFDQEPEEGVLHSDDRLGATGDAVYLLCPDGTTILDSHTWSSSSPLADPDVSLGRFPNGWSDWYPYGEGQLYSSTPGAANLGLANTAPVLSQISYDPMPAMAGQPLTISVQVIDAENNLASVVLDWGFASPAENSLVMALDAGEYKGVCGSFGMGQPVHFQIRATDAQDSETLSSIYTIFVGYQPPSLYINEIMAANTMTVTDNYGEHEDWVEIYNAGNSPINLAGFCLTDHHFGNYTYALQPISASQPDSTTIPARGYMVFWFDEQPDQGVMHINTRLNVLDDAVYLVGPDRLLPLDRVSWNISSGMTADLSYGRSPDGSSTWAFFGGVNPGPPTPGSSNTGSANGGEIAPQIPITLAYYPNPAQTSLSIELRNTKQPARFRIYNLKGGLVKELNWKPGSKSVWDCRDQRGCSAASGIYILKAELGDRTLSGKLCLIH